MAVTDAEFDKFLADESRKKVVLAELQFAYESGGTGPFEGTVYLANHPYRTGPGDLVPNRAYRDVIEAAPRIASAIDAVTLSGPAAIEVGNLELANTDGELDFLLDLIVDGREIAFYVGDEDWPRADFRAVLVATMVNVEAPNEERLTVRVASSISRLDTDIIGKELTTGPEAGKFLTLLAGAAFNLTPRLLNSTDLTYSVCYPVGGALEWPALVSDVRDAGVSLATGEFFSASFPTISANTGTDTFTYVGHGLALNDVVRFGFPYGGSMSDPALDVDTDYWVISAGLTADDFRLSATRGGSAIDLTVAAFASGTVTVYRYRYAWTATGNTGIQLSSAPTGRITVDVQSKTSSPTSPFAYAKKLIEYATTIYGGMTAPDFDSAAFTAADTALEARYGGASYLVNVAVEDRENLINVLVRLLEPVAGWFGVNRSGEITCGIIDPSNIASLDADHEITKAQMDEGTFSVLNQPVRAGYVNVNYYHNLSPQTDGLAASVSVEDAALYRQEWPQQANAVGGAGTTYAGAWWTYHKSAVTRVVEAETGIVWNASPPASIAADEIATELVEDNQPHRKLVRFTTSWEAYDWDLGDVVLVTHPRHGFAAGVKCRVIGIERLLTEGSFAVTLITRVAPDYTTVEHDA